MVSVGFFKKSKVKQLYRKPDFVHFFVDLIKYEGDSLSYPEGEAPQAAGGGGETKNPRVRYDLFFMSISHENRSIEILLPSLHLVR